MCIGLHRVVDRVGRNLIRKLLERDRTHRLGCMANGVNDIKEHPWFQSIVWTDIIEYRVRVKKSLSRFSTSGDLF